MPKAKPKDDTKEKTVRKRGRKPSDPVKKAEEIKTLILKKQEEIKELKKQLKVQEKLIKSADIEKLAGMMKNSKKTKEEIEKFFNS